MQTVLNKQIFSFGNNQVCHQEQHYEQILLLKLQIVRLTETNQQLISKQSANEDVINKINAIERNLNQQLKFKEDRIQQLNLVIKNLHFQCHEKNQRIENLKSNYKQLQQTYLKQASQLRALSAYSAKQQLAQKNLSLFQHYQCKIRQALKEKDQQFTSLIQTTQNTLLHKEKQILLQKQARQDLSARILELQRQINIQYQEQQTKKIAFIQHENKISVLQEQLVNKEIEYKQQVQRIMNEKNNILKQKMILEQKLNEGFEILLRRETKIRQLTENLYNQMSKNKVQTEKIQSMQRKLQKKFKIQNQQAIASIKNNILQQYSHKENKLQQQLLSLANVQNKMQNSERQFKQQLTRATQKLKEKDIQIERFKQKYNSLQRQKQQTQFQWKQLLRQTARQRNIIQNMQNYEQNNAQICSYNNDVQKQESTQPLIYAMKKNKLKNSIIKKQEIQQASLNNLTNQLQKQVEKSSYIEQKYQIEQKIITASKLQKTYKQYKQEQMQQNQIQKQRKFCQAYSEKPVPNIRTYVDDLKNKYSFQRDVEHIPKVSINKNMECQQCVNRRSFQISSNKYNSVKEDQFSFINNSQDIDYYIKKKKQLIFNKSNSITLLRSKCDRTLIHNFDSNSCLRLNAQNRSKSYQHISQNKFTNSSLADNIQGSRQLYSIFSTKNTQADNNRMIKCQPYLDYDTSKQQFLQKLVYSKGWKDSVGVNKQNSCLLRKQSNCVNNIINKLEGNKHYLNLSKGRKLDRKNYKLKIYDKQNQ